MSTTIVENTTAIEAAKEVLWVTRLVKELDVEKIEVRMHFDSHNVIYLANNQVCHTKTKHVDVRFQKFKESIALRQILFKTVHNSEDTTDMLTKSVPMISSYTA